MKKTSTFEVRRQCSPSHILTLSSISKTYRGGVLALDDISLSVAEGEILAVIGSSGAGKSTLLKCINRLEECEGEIIFEGLSIQKIRGRALRQARRKIGMIFQNYNLVECLPVIDNVLHGILGKLSFFRSIFSLYTKEELIQANEIIEAVGLSEMKMRACSALSGGQKQRVGIARSLMQQPSIILADEPTSSLDIKTSRTILQLLQKNCKERGIACIINLHQIELAREFADRIVGLKMGQVVFDGKVAELSEEVLKKIF